MPQTLDRTAIQAPTRLVADTRWEFRAAALDRLSHENVRDGRRALTIDLGVTQDIDASGLGILVLVQKRARERGLATCLLNTQQPVRALLTMTKLDGLFEFA